MEEPVSAILRLISYIHSTLTRNREMLIEKCFCSKIRLR